jgi:hypothetical protein
VTDEPPEEPAPTDDSPASMEDNSLDDLFKAMDSGDFLATPDPENLKEQSAQPEQASSEPEAESSISAPDMANVTPEEDNAGSPSSSLQEEIADVEKLGTYVLEIATTSLPENVLTTPVTVKEEENTMAAKKIIVDKSDDFDDDDETSSAAVAAKEDSVKPAKPRKPPVKADENSDLEDDEDSPHIKESNPDAKRLIDKSENSSSDDDEDEDSGDILDEDEEEAEEEPKPVKRGPGRPKKGPEDPAALPPRKSKKEASPEDDDDGDDDDNEEDSPPKKVVVVNKKAKVEVKESSDDLDESPVPTPAPEKRGPGRPKKIVENSSTPKVAAPAPTPAPVAEPKRRGRPPKNPTATAAPTAAKAAPAHASVAPTGLVAGFLAEVSSSFTGEAPNNQVNWARRFTASYIAGLSSYKSFKTVMKPIVEQKQISADAIGKIKDFVNSDAGKNLRIAYQARMLLDIPSADLAALTGAVKEDILALVQSNAAGLYLAFEVPHDDDETGVPRIAKKYRKLLKSRDAELATSFKQAP